MSSGRFTLMLFAACLFAAALVTSCARNPGEDYQDTSIRELIASQPGLYELTSTVENPVDIVTEGENWIVIRQGKDMIIAGGDSLEHIMQSYQGQDYSIIGRRMGQPKLWFAVDGIVQDERMATRVSQTNEKVFPSYEPFTREAVSEYGAIDLADYDFDKERRLRAELVGEKTRITGTLVTETTEAGDTRYLVESRNLKVELTPVGKNLEIFLTMAQEVGSPFVAYGTLTDTYPWDDGTEQDRGSSQVVGPYNVDFYRFGRDILVRNILPAS